MWFRKVLVSLGSLGLVCLIAGCPGNRTVAPSNAARSDRKAAAEDMLQSAIHQLRPENFAIAAEPDKPVALLNSWTMAVQEKAGKTGESKPAQSVPDKWVSEMDADRIKHDSYDHLDGVHIRDAMLARVMSGYLAARGKTDVQQVMAVFDFTVRNLAFRRSNEIDLPLGTYYLLLLGKGSAEDRAWVCSALLKQLRIDSVILQFSEKDNDAETWLLGVILKDQVYLFDPRLGLPIPPSADPSLPIDTPATLDQLMEHPEWLDQLAVREQEPYAIRSEMLKKLRVHVIADPNYWFHRMKVLEEALPASDVCVLYDPLLDVEGRQGLLTRLAACKPEWKEDELRPWAHLNRERFRMTQETYQYFDSQMRFFELPIPVLAPKDSKDKITTGKPELGLLRTRTDQLLGNFEEAIKRYFSIRHLEIDPEQLSIPQLALGNKVAAEDAIYWTAVCKFEAKEYSAAVEQLNTYLKRYERNGRWNFVARSLLAESQAALGKFDVAAEYLGRSSSSEDPYRSSNIVRSKRWGARAAKGNQTNQPAKSE